MLETLKKYEITNIRYDHFGEILYRIRALRDFGDVKAGQLGGYIQAERNLAHEGNCWIYNALVYHDAVVKGNAKAKGGWIWNRAVLRQEAIADDGCFISCDAECFGQATIKDTAHISEFAKVFDKCLVRQQGSVSGRAVCHGRSEIYGYGRASGTSELTGTFKLRGSGKLFEGVHEKGVVETWSPFTSDVTLHG